ncbi:MAG: Crp/Fnr family transcriptional regulator [Candidatus Levybacteria bacterium]|nr:Crp/Fnr family transcriptional regulator [Candidatus Levybacteria bacterium]
MNIALIRFFYSLTPHAYKKGQIILRSEMKAYSYLYYLEKGYIKAYSLLSNGNEKNYVFYKSGEIFPITWTFNNLNKHLYYQAMSDVILYKVPRQKFINFIHNKPNVLLDVVHRIIDIHNIYIDRVDNLEYTNSCARVISCLLFLAKRFGKKKNNSILIQIPLTHNDIATSIAMTRETASREIEQLMKLNIISTKDHLIFIKDIKRLEKKLEDCIGNNCH